MKVLVLAGILFAACFQAEGRAIGQETDDFEIPKVLRETMEQSFGCAMQLGPSKALQIPKLSGKGIQELPEDNPALNELWGCIWKKKGIIDDNSDVHADKLEGYLVEVMSLFGEPDSKITETAHLMTEHCKNVEAHDYGLKAVKIQNCMFGYTRDNLITK